MSETVWERRECVSAEVEDSLVLLDLETLVYHSLNRTAASTWEALATPRSAPQVVAELCAKYNVTEEACTASVERFLGELSAKGLISPKATVSDAA